MKNIFTAILFLNLFLSFGQENTAPKEEPKLIKENEVESKIANSGNHNVEVPISKDENIDYTKIFHSVQVQAIPPGGMNAFRKHIASSFKLPEVAEKTTGTVIVKFVVWDDGSIREAQIIKETPIGLGLGNEAVRLLSSSEKWIPGMFNGFKVKQYYTLPISIQITPKEKMQNSINGANKDKQ